MNFDVNEAIQRFDENGLLSNNMLDYLSSIEEKVYRCELFLQLYLEEIKKVDRGNQRFDRGNQSIRFKLRRLFRINWDLRDFNIERERLNEHFNRMGAFSSTVIHNIHTIGDSLGKIINETVIIKNRLTPQKYLFNVNQELKTHNHIAPNLSTALDTLINSDEWTYINAFDNTEKHQKLINLSDNRNLGQKNIVPAYKAFTYRSNPFNDKEINKIIINDREIIHSYIDTVFDELYNHLNI